MAGMFGIVRWEPTSRNQLESEMPKPGRYFRGSISTASTADTCAVKVHARNTDYLTADHGHHALAMLGKRNPDFADEFEIIDSFDRNAEETLERIGSQFAFFLANSATKRTCLATDPFGSYPIYYAKTDLGLVFSTDLDSISKHPLIDATISQQSIYDYLYFTTIPAPSTIYEKIFRLPLGHMLVIDNAKVTIRQWYRPTPHGGLNNEDYALSLRNALSTAVQSRWENSESACFLSGGLDSSTVCGLAAQIDGPGVPAYSIGFPENDYDEIPYAKIAGNQYALDHRVHYVSVSEIYDNLMPVLGAFGEPFSNASTISTYVCAKRAVNDGFSNLLAGDGGDELFAGNERYERLMKLNKFKLLPAALQSLLASLNVKHGMKLPGSLRKLSSYITQASMPFSHQLQYYNFVEQSGYGNIFSRSFLDSINPEQPKELLQDIYETAPFESHLKRMLYVDWRITLADNDLRKVRMACDIAGAEVQFPMLDAGVVSVSAEIPGRLMMQGGKLRGFYKRAFSDFLPDAILTKPKHGFGVPVGRWMQSDKVFGNFVGETLTALAKREIFDPDFLIQVRRAHRNENAVHFGVVLWTLVILELWLQSKRY